jgi:cytochrome c oxidase subunit 2
MVTQFAFEPIYTTDEYRELPFMVEKVANINAIRKKALILLLKVKLLLDPHLITCCNKICGASHYNMQMKIL